MQAPQQPERAIIALPVLASRMMSLLPHPPAPGAPLPPDFASSAAWPVLHIDFDTQAAKVFTFTATDYLRAAFLDERALAHRPLRGLEIGRASCRERVCKDV